MFVQVISGPVADEASVKAQFDSWEQELRPSAVGYLGGTAGVSGDRFIAIARFESADAARANSDRPEQGEWWAATEKLFTGEVSFSNSEDVTLLLGGGSDDAGFVQIIEGSDTDRARLEALDGIFDEHAASWRPEVIGGLRAWTGPDSYVEAIYFTSEAEARAGEGSEPPPEAAEGIGELRELMAKATFTDISDPWFR